jgi:CBS domain-containing protein
MARVNDVMTREVVTVTEGTSIKNLCRILSEHKISGVPVVSEEGDLVGIVSEKDVVAHQVAGLEPDFVDADLYELISSKYLGHDELARGQSRMYVEEIMNRTVITVAPDIDIAEAAHILLEKGRRRLPVAEGGKVVGIVSALDLLRALLPEGVGK